MAGEFSSMVSDWASKTEERLTAVYRRSVELLADEMTATRAQGGRVPFDTGNLARSLLASTSGMPKTSEGLSVGFDVGAVTAMLSLDSPVWLGYQAVYARVANYGMVGQDKLGRNQNRDGNYFVESAIESWEYIVQLAAEDIESKNAGH